MLCFHDALENCEQFVCISEQVEGFCVNEDLLNIRMKSYFYLSLKI